MTMESGEVYHSPLYLPPYDDESISHYLGRWFRQEVVQTDAIILGKKLRLGKILWRWQNFYLNPEPTREQIAKIGGLMELEVERLLLMFPPENEVSSPRPIRLCAFCYVEAPYHKLEWQFRSTAGCERHQCRLLSKCPACEKPFAIPAQWEKGSCQGCGMLFKSMTKRQKPY
ncbi:MAG: TniQ family protein [Leptolyngbya sp. BL-A-14]